MEKTGWHYFGLVVAWVVVAAGVIVGIGALWDSAKQQGKDELRAEMAAEREQAEKQGHNDALELTALRGFALNVLADPQARQALRGIRGDNFAVGVGAERLTVCSSVHGDFGGTARFTVSYPLTYQEGGALRSLGSAQVQENRSYCSAAVVASY